MGTLYSEHSTFLGPRFRPRPAELRTHRMRAELSAVPWPPSGAPYFAGASQRAVAQCCTPPPAVQLFLHAFTMQFETFNAVQLILQRISERCKQCSSFCRVVLNVRSSAVFSAVFVQFSAYSVSTAGNIGCDDVHWSAL